MAISTGSKILADDFLAQGYVTSTILNTVVNSISGSYYSKRIGQLMIISFNGCYFTTAVSSGQACLKLIHNSSGAAVNARQAAFASIHTGDGVARHIQIYADTNAIVAGNTGIPANIPIYGGIVIPIAYND